MLVFSRNPNQSVIAQLTCGGLLKTTVLETRGDRVRLGFEAPRHVPVHRQEVFDRIQSNSVQSDRPFFYMVNMPANVAESYESMKLSIMSHKLAGWNEISKQQMLGALAALADVARAA